MMIAAVLAAQLAGRALALTPFVEQLRKAEARSPSDPERVEFATRALRAWAPSDGSPLLAHAHFLRAEGEALNFDDAAAEEDLTKALELDERNDRARLMRSRARAALGLGATAESDALDYLSARHDDPEGWLALGEARLLRRGDKADREARAAFARAAKFADAGDPRPSHGEGRAHLAARRHGEALAAFTAAAGGAQKRRAEILSWRSRAYSALGDWGGAQSDLTKAIPGLERALDERRRSGAAPCGVDKARADLADAYFRRGLAGEALRAKEAALADHRQACGLGHAGACARAAALEKPETKPAAKPAPKKKPRRANPKSDAGDRIYAN